MADIVNKAYEDEMLSEDEMKLIQEKRQEIQTEIDKLREAEYHVTLDNIVADVSGGGLSPDSFNQLGIEMNEQIAERAKELEQQKIEALIPFRAQLDAGEISQQEYDKIKQQYELGAKEALGDINLEGVNLTLGVVNTNYKDQLDRVKSEYQQYTSGWVQDMLDSDTFSMEYILNSVSQAQTRFSSALSEDAQKTIRSALENLKPEKEYLEEVALECQKAGYVVPENIKKGLTDIYQMEALLGESEGLFAELARGIAQSPEKC